MRRCDCDVVDKAETHWNACLAVLNFTLFVMVSSTLRHE